MNIRTRFMSNLDGDGLSARPAMGIVSKQAGRDGQKHSAGAEHFELESPHRIDLARRHEGNDGADRSGQKPAYGGEAKAASSVESVSAAGTERDAGERCVQVQVRNHLQHYGEI